MQHHCLQSAQSHCVLVDTLTLGLSCIPAGPPKWLPVVFLVCGVQFSDAALAAAAALDRPLGAAQLEEGVAHLKRVNQERGAMLDGLIEKLVDLFEEGNL